MKQFFVLAIGLIITVNGYCQSSKRYASIGEAREKAHDYKGALLYYSKAIALNDDDNAAYLARGKVRKKQKDFMGAIHDFTHVIITEELLLERYLNKDSSMVADLKWALSDAYDWRGKCKMELFDARGAIIDYNKGIEKLGKNNDYIVDLYFDRGYANFSLKNYESAIDDFDEDIKLDPSRVESFFNRGSSKFQLDDKDGACLDWSKAGELGSAKAYQMIKKYCQ